MVKLLLFYFKCFLAGWGLGDLLYIISRFIKNKIGYWQLKRKLLKTSKRPYTELFYEMHLKNRCKECGRKV